MRLASLLIFSVAFTALRAECAEFHPKSFKVITGAYSGMVSDLQARNDLKLLDIYSSSRGAVSAIFTIPYTSSKLSSLEIGFIQDTSSSVYIFQVKNSQGEFREVGRTSGNANVLKSLSFNLSNLNLPERNILVRIQASKVNDFKIDYLAVKDLLVPPPAPAPVPAPAPEPAPAPTGGIPAGSSWYWQLQGTINLTRTQQNYDIDLYDSSSNTISQLKLNGKRVICYFSAGSYEEWRSDASLFPAIALGRNLDGWAGERWLDVRNSQVRDIMSKRIQLAKQKGCDGVEPDNVDGYSNNSGFPLTSADQINYNRFLAQTAHANGLLIGLKNSTDLVSSLVHDFDFAVVEECFKYNECSAYSPFIQNNKAVFNAEYSSFSASICTTAKQLRFSTAFFNLSLDGKVFTPCN